MLSKARQKLLFTVFLVGAFGWADAQPSVQFYEIIKEDSAQLFCDNTYVFTSAECAQFRRYSRLTSSGEFDGAFQDIDTKQRLIASGNYVKGIKNGPFQEYYPNGKLRISGHYENNKPANTWNSFQEDGSPEREIRFTGSDTLLVFLYSENGKLLVDNGNGMFAGRVETSPGVPDHFAEGQVKDGRRTGPWKISNAAVRGFKNANEVFSDGKYIQGKTSGGKNLPKSTFDLVLTPWFPLLERYKAVPCKGPELQATGLAVKRASIKSQTRLKRYLQSVLQEKAILGYGNFGEEIRLRIKIDKEGVPVEVGIVSDRSNIMATRVAYIMKQEVRWSPALKNNTPVEQVQYMYLRYVDTMGGWHAEWHFSDN